MSIKIKSVSEVLNRYDHFIFDMDGVLVLNKHLYSGLVVISLKVELKVFRH